MRTADPSPERSITQAIIQLANARLKIRMGKMNAAQRLCGMVDNLLVQCAGSETILGLEPKTVNGWVKETRESIQV
jgi:hypothetical protein